MDFEIDLDQVLDKEKERLRKEKEIEENAENLS